MESIASPTASGIAAGTLDTPFRPVATAERIDFLDALRGFALIGILLMNIEWFNRPWVGPSIDTDLLGVDYAAGLFVHVFVTGKFVTLFSLLFGIGFALMLDRAIERGQPFTVMYLRRLLALGLFGVLHGIFLWYGDILFAYAIAALVLMGWVWLLRRPRLQRFDNPDSILRFGLGYLALPLVLLTAFGTYYILSHDTAELRANWERRMAVVEQAKAIQEQAKTDGIDLNAESDQASRDDESVAQAARERAQRLAAQDKDEVAQHAAWTSPSFAVVLQQRIKQWREFLSYIPFQVLVGTLPLFIIGYWLVRSGRVRDTTGHRGFYKALMYAGIGLGLPIMLASVAVDAHPAAFYIGMLDATYSGLGMFGDLLLAAGYLGLIVTMSLSTAWRRPLMWLAPMGRMALTNYVMQSLIASLFFYGYGLGQYGSFPRAPQMLLAAAILVFQCVFSALWLKAFRFGPLEWLWRSFTYWRWQPLRNAAAVRATGRAVPTQNPDILV